MNSNYKPCRMCGNAMLKSPKKYCFRCAARMKAAVKLNGCRLWRTEQKIVGGKESSVRGSRCVVCAHFSSCLDYICKNKPTWEAWDCNSRGYIKKKAEKKIYYNSCDIRESWNLFKNAPAERKMVGRACAR